MMFFSFIGSVIMLLAMTVISSNAGKNIQLRYTRSDNSKKSLDQIINALFYISDVYDGKRYYLSRAAVQNNITGARSSCGKIDGVLAEVDHDSELQFIKDFIKLYLPGFSSVFIGGTDDEAEGHFVYRASGKPLTYFAWGKGQPDNYRNQDCIALEASVAWEMSDLDCKFGLLGAQRFLCEVAGPEVARPEVARPEPVFNLTIPTTLPVPILSAPKDIPINITINLIFLTNASLARSERKTTGKK